MQEKVKMGAAIIILFIVIIVVVGLFTTKFYLSEGEGVWQCQVESGTWIKKGNPVTPMPTSTCGMPELTMGTMGDCLLSDTLSRDKCDLLIEYRKELEDYIKDNISKLSPEAAVLGGKFYVTQIKWIDDHSKAVVDYEDGHVALSANVILEGKGEDIKVSSFQIIKDNGENSKINFTKEGNLSKNNPGLKKDIWYLVYEEQGAPALKVELEFNDKSLCVVNSSTSVCEVASLKTGDRYKIEGFNQDGKLTVIKMTKIVESAGTAVGIANPASVYCIENGGEIEIVKDVDGNQMGYCVFSNGKRCEEWAYMRGQCKK